MLKYPKANYVIVDYYMYVILNLGHKLMKFKIIEYNNSNKLYPLKQ